MHSGASVLALVLLASFATAQQPARSGQRTQPNMRPTTPRGRPAPPPPVPPRAPRQPIVSPQAQPPFVPTPQPQARTPFDATSRTYAPRYDGRSTRRRYGPPYYSSAFGIGGLLTGTDNAAVPEEPLPLSDAAEPPRLTSPIYEPPRVVVASRGPDTYYVIPGCYAGNRKPEPQSLPKGCDPAKLRTTPVR